MNYLKVNISRIIVYPMQQDASQKGNLAPLISSTMPNSTELTFVDDYLPALLAQASTLISAEFHAIVLASGFSISEWRILATLTGGDGISIGGLAQVTLTKQPTVTRLLDRMEAKNCVQRYAHESDRRITMVHITHLGRQIVGDLIVQAKAHEQRVLKPFSADQAVVLKATLRKLIELHRPVA
jgi:DNA-binding MarR family transcriptional regulator